MPQDATPGGAPLRHADAAPHVGMHCPMQACAALLLATDLAPNAAPLLSPPFAAVRSAAAPLYRAEGPERPPNL